MQPDTPLTLRFVAGMLGIGVLGFLGLGGAAEYRQAQKELWLKQKTDNMSAMVQQVFPALQDRLRPLPQRLADFFQNHFKPIEVSPFLVPLIFRNRVRNIYYDRRNDAYVFEAYDRFGRPYYRRAFLRGYPQFQRL